MTTNVLVVLLFLLIPFVSKSAALPLLVSRVTRVQREDTHGTGNLGFSAKLRDPTQAQ